ncbi:MAG: type I-U CRISPR-associated helicase/endonuclease Cas3 [Deltaproteobacteria bacterium]|nr:type I-U CRISPR-associated helicase/endonuclease Cas3 [Deltaproteobacteria bacterium]
MPSGALTADAFAGFFHGVHGFAPYPWQERLVRRVIGAGTWPEAVDLPTGSGKTTLIDIAVFALAANPETAPRRLVYIINRRTVVDQAFEHVLKLQSALTDSGDPAVRRVSDCLRDVCNDAPINGVRLRGGIRDLGTWADRPDTAWVTVATIDQFGSKLLFRAYGSGPKMRPVHAGLAGNDCLVILDEAHLDKPFAETVRQVRDAQPDTSGLPRRYEIVEMSATPVRSVDDRFTFDEDDLACAEFSRRVTSPKDAFLRMIDWSDPHRTIPAAVLDIAQQLDEREQTVGVVVNRVRTALETHRALIDALGPEGWDVHLLTGRMRPLDRDDAVVRVQAAVDPERATGASTPTVVVATQCIEAGADYSFDALVTEVAPIDSLRQRFGRLDRRGKLSATTRQAARAWIVGPARPKSAESFVDDPVYGGAVSVTWDELLERTERGATPFDASPLASHAFPEAAYTTRLSAPLLLPHHMDAWAQTNPVPAQAPSIDRFLHGMLPDREAHRPADVSIVWRHDRSPAAVREVPIRGAEKLQVPWRAAVAWLTRDMEINVSDVGNETVDTSATLGRHLDTSEDWCRFTGQDTAPELIGPGDIHPGDVLLVDPARGGLSNGTWCPSSREAVSDLGDAAQHAYQRRYTLRLDPRLHAGLPHPPRPFDDGDAPDSERIDAWLAAVAATPGLPAWMIETLDKVASPRRRVRRIGAGGAAYFVVSAGLHAEADTMDGSDESQSVTGAGVPLRDHLSRVGDRVREYAERLGLSADLCDDLELAARLHDIGKADPRFQRQMVGGDVVRLECLDEPLAKSLPGARTDPAGWPAVYHELLGVLMARDSDRLRDAHDEDLVLHLIGNHHGRARSLPLLRPDRNPRSVTYSDGAHVYCADTAAAGPALATEMTERFWRLSRRYGHHGLAWLEAIMRQADQQESALERGTE